MLIRRLSSADLPRLVPPAVQPQVRRFWSEHWSGGTMIAHGEIFRPEQLDGFVADDWLGLVTFYIGQHACEIISLDSLEEGQGIDTTLIAEVAKEARKQNCLRLFLTTTNDNLHALGFYQRRGFALAAIRPGALDESRRIKPGIPLIGMNDIPLRDEIELEMSLIPSPQTPLPAGEGQG